MKESTLLLPFPLSLSSISSTETSESDNLVLKSLLKKMSHLIINGGNPEDYEMVYYSIPSQKMNIREAFVRKVFKKARQENWSVSRIEEVMKKLNQM